MEEKNDQFFYNALVKDMLNDVLLVAEMYSLDYPFDADHRKKHAKLFQKAHMILGNTMEDIKKACGIE